MPSEDRGTCLGLLYRIREDVEGFVGAPRVERLDLVVMHQQPVEGTPVEVYWEALLELRSEGKACEVGLSNHGAEYARERADQPGSAAPDRFPRKIHETGPTSSPGAISTAPRWSPGERCTAGCSVVPSMRAAPGGWPTTTGGASSRSSPIGLLPTCRWSPPCVRSQTPWRLGGRRRDRVAPQLAGVTGALAGARRPSTSRD